MNYSDAENACLTGLAPKFEGINIEMNETALPDPSVQLHSETGRKSRNMTGDEMQDISKKLGKIKLIPTCYLQRSYEESREFFGRTDVHRRQCMMRKNIRF